MQFMRRQMRKASCGKLSIAQLRTLYFIGISDCPSLSATADFIGLSLPAMSRLVDGLVKAELATRTSCPNDRRQIRLAITPTGQAAIDQSWKSTRSRLAEEVSALSPEHREVIVSAMDVLRDIFDPKTVKG